MNSVARQAVKTKFNFISFWKSGVLPPDTSTPPPLCVKLIALYFTNFPGLICVLVTITSKLCTIMFC